MRIILLLATALALAGLSGCDRIRHREAPPPAEEPFPELDPQALGAVVRVEMGGRFRGAGIAVAPRHVVTALANLDEWEYHRREAFVGPDHVPGRVIVVDKRRGMALIRTERPLAKRAVLAQADPAERSPAVVVAYAELESEPKMIELRMLRGQIDQTGFSRDTTGDMEVNDALLVSSPNASDVRRRGAGVFDPVSGKLVGMVVGAMLERPQSTSPFIAVSAKTIRAFLRENGLTQQ